MRVELMTPSLPRKCSTPELHRQIERETRLELATHSLEGYCSTNWATPAYICHQHPWNLPGERASCCYALSEWGEQDSNLRSHSTTDLQSAPVGHFGISPFKTEHVWLDIHLLIITWADEGIRTPDLQITNQLLWPTELHRHLKERPISEENTLKNRFANVEIYISNLK